MTESLQFAERWQRGCRQTRQSFTVALKFRDKTKVSGKRVGKNKA